DGNETPARTASVGFDRTLGSKGACRSVVGLDVRRIRDVRTHPGHGYRGASASGPGKAGDRAGIYGWPALNDSAGMGRRRNHSRCAYRLYRSPPHAHVLDPMVRGLHRIHSALAELLVPSGLPVSYGARLGRGMGTGLRHRLRILAAFISWSRW